MLGKKNSYPLGEQQELLTADPSFQPLQLCSFLSFLQYNGYKIHGKYPESTEKIVIPGSLNNRLMHKFWLLFYFGSVLY